MGEYIYMVVDTPITLKLPLEVFRITSLFIAGCINYHVGR